MGGVGNSAVHTYGWIATYLTTKDYLCISRTYLPQISNEVCSLSIFEYSLNAIQYLYFFT